MADKRMDIVLELKDNFSKGLAAQEGNLKRFSAGIGVAVAAAGIGIAAGIGGAIKVAADFDQTLSNIGAVGGPAAAQAMDQISAKALQIGKDTAFSSVEAASAMEELIKAGIPVADVLNGAADATVALAAAGEISLPRAAEIASAAKNQFQMTAAEMPHVADMIAGAANASAISTEDFGESIKALGPAASTVGVGFDDASAAIALMGKYGLKGSMAGNTLKRMLLSLTAPSDTAAATMERLGINVFDSAGKIKSGAAVAEELKTATAGLSEQARTAALSDIFGSFGLAGAAVMAKEGAAGFNVMADSMAKVSAADVAKQKLDNLAGAITILKGSTETAAVMLGSAFQPVLQGLVTNLTSVVNATMPLIEQFAVEFPARFEAFKVGVIAAFQGVTGWVTANWPLVGTVVGLVGLTVATTFLSMAGSAAMFGLALLTSGVFSLLSFVGIIATSVIPAIMMFGTTLLTQGVGAALSYAGSLLAGVIPANAAAGASFLVNLIPSVLSAGAAFVTTAATSALAFGQMLMGAATTAVAVGASFLTSTLPALATTAAGFVATGVAAAGAFLVMLNGALLAAPGMAMAFLTQTVPAMAATALGFVTTAAASAASFATMLAGALVTGAGIAIAFLTVTVPAAIATAIAFASMAVGALASFAVMVAGAVVAGIGVALAFWPITLAAIAVVAIAVFVYKNWSAIWGGIVKFTGAAGKAIGSVLRATMTFGASVVSKGGAFIGKAFGAMGAVGAKATSGMSKIVRKGLASMAGKATEIIGKMVSWIGEKLAAMVNFALTAIRSLPGADAIAGMIGNVGAGIQNALKFGKQAFDAGGDDGEAYVDGWNQSANNAASAGGGLDLGDLGIDLSAMGIEGGEMPGVGGAGAGIPGAGAGGGGGGGAAGASDPMGIWSGTDSKGAWTIDPGTGKKIYEAGSVGATGQANSASEKAAREAAKQAKAGKGKSKLGDAVGGALKGSESMDLAKAFASAIGDAADLITDLVGFKLPSRDQWMPQLDVIRSFFMDAGRVFADVAADARNKTDKITGKGAVSKEDLENLTVMTEPFMGALSMLEKSIGILGDLSDLKMPKLSIMDDVQAFMLRAAESGKVVLASVDRATAELWIPITTGFSAWMDALGKAAKTASDIAALGLAGDLIPGLARVEGFMREVGIRTGAFVASAQKALGDELEVALAVSRDVAGTFGAWFDSLAKVGASAKAIGEMKLDGGWQARLSGFMTGVAAIGALYVVGLSNAVPPEGRGPALALSRDVATTFGAWGDSLVKMSEAANKIAAAKPVTDEQLGHVRDLMSRVAELGASFLRGDGYDLTKDAKRTAQDLGIVRDVFATLAAGVDTVTKAGALDLSKATKATAAQLDIVRHNASASLVTIVVLSTHYRDMSEAARTTLFGALKAYGEAVGSAIDVLAKAGGLDLSKATELTTEQLRTASDNAISALGFVLDISMHWQSMAQETQAALVADLKSYAEAVTTATDILSKAGGLDLSGASELTLASLKAATSNAIDAIGFTLDLIGYWQRIKEETRTKLVADLKSYSEAVGSAVDILSKAGGLDLSNAVELTTAGLQTASDNAVSAMGFVMVLVEPFQRMKDETRTALFAAIKGYADAVGSAVGALGDAAGLGAELAKASSILPGSIEIAEANARAALASVRGLAGEWDHMASDARALLFKSIKEYADTAGEAVSLLTDAAGLGAAMAKARPISAAQFASIGTMIRRSIETLAQVVADVGPDALMQAEMAGQKAQPVIEAVSKILDAFSMEKILASPLIVSKTGSAWSTRARQTRAQALANQIQAGIQLMFQTLAGAAANIPPISGDVASKVAAIVSAYDPLLTLIEKLNGLTIDLTKIETLARVPGLLSAGLGSGGGTGAPGGAGGGAAAAPGAMMFTGPISTTGPAYFNGVLNLEVSLDGEAVTRIQRSGQWQIDRGRESRVGATA